MNRHHGEFPGRIAIALEPRGSPRVAGRARRAAAADFSGNKRTCDGHCRQRIEVGESRPVAGQCSICNRWQMIGDSQPRISDQRRGAQPGTTTLRTIRPRIDGSAPNAAARKLQTTRRGLVGTPSRDAKRDAGRRRTAAPSNKGAPASCPARGATLVRLAAVAAGAHDQRGGHRPRAALAAGTSPGSGPCRASKDAARPCRTSGSS